MSRPTEDVCGNERDPISRFVVELSRAVETEAFDATRCALATVSVSGAPSVRFVLCKSVCERGFVFYTNYESAKAADLRENPRAALAFHWHSTGVQIRVAGDVCKVTEQESDAYFASRDRDSQIGACASQQSAPLPDRGLLEQRVREIDNEFEGKAVPRPSSWGGFRIAPRTVEFWYNRENRLHDRFAYTRQDDEWVCARLYP